MKKKKRVLKVRKFTLKERVKQLRDIGKAVDRKDERIDTLNKQLLSQRMTLEALDLGRIIEKKDREIAALKARVDAQQEVLEEFNLWLQERPMTWKEREVAKYQHDRRTEERLQNDRA